MTIRCNTGTRRIQIARAAITLIAERGIEGLSMGAIARQIGVVPSAIYRHFRNKDEVVEAGLTDVRTRMMSNLAAAISGEESPLERLEFLMGAQIAMARDIRIVPAILFAADRTGKDYPARKATIRSSFEKYINGVETLIREGQECGEIRRDADPATAARIFLGAIMPGALLWHLTDGDFDITKYGKNAWDFYCDSLKACKK